MKVITMMMNAGWIHEAVSVQANLRSKLCRSQNQNYSKVNDSVHEIVFVKANLRSKLCSSQNRYGQKGLPA